MSMTHAPSADSGGISPDDSTLAALLAKNGYVIVPDFLPVESGRALFREISSLWNEGNYREAAVGRGEGKQIRSGIRSDHVKWLDPASLTIAQQGYWDCMEKLRLALNRELFLGLFDLEAHLACFPAGARYKAHLDRHRGSEARLLSAIVYLNNEWQAEDGGELRLYTDREAGTEGPSLDILPEFGKLVLFLSDEFWHEVLPARRNRHSITGWFRKRDGGPPM